MKRPLSKTRSVLRGTGACAVWILIIGFVALPALLAWRAEERAEDVIALPTVGNSESLALIENAPNADRVVRLAVLGDLQLGAPMLPRIMRSVGSRGPFDFVVHTGDFSARPREGHFNIALSEFGEFPAGAPLLIIPGNHDVRESARDRTVSPWFKEAFGPSEYVLEYAGALFVFLDNSMGPLSDAKYVWLEDALRRHEAKSKPVLFFMHAQPISWEGDGKASPEPFYRPLFVLLEQYEIDAVFTGNWHGYYTETRNGTQFVVNGHGGDLDNENPFAKVWYTVAEISAGGLKLEPVAVRRTVLSVVTSHYYKAIVANWGHFLAERPWAWILAGLATLGSTAWLCYELVQAAQMRRETRAA